MRREQLKLLADAKKSFELDVGLADAAPHLNDLSVDEMSPVAMAASRGNLVSLAWLMSHNAAIAGNGIGDVLFWSRNSQETLAFLLKTFESGKGFTAHPHLSLAHVQAACGNVEFFSGENRGALTKPNPLGISPAFFAACNRHDKILALLDFQVLLDPKTQLIQEPTQVPMTLNEWRTRASYLFVAGHLNLDYFQKALEISKSIPLVKQIYSDKKLIIACAVELMNFSKDNESKTNYCLLALNEIELISYKPSSLERNRFFEILCLSEPVITKGPDYERALTLLARPFYDLSDDMLRLVARNTNLKAEALPCIKNKTLEESDFVYDLEIDKKILSLKRLRDNQYRENGRLHTWGHNADILAELFKLNRITQNEIEEIILLLGHPHWTIVDSRLYPSNSRDSYKVLGGGRDWIASAVSHFRRIPDAKLRNSALRSLINAIPDSMLLALEAIDPKTDADYRSLAGLSKDDKQKCAYLGSIAKKNIDDYRTLGTLYIDMRSFQDSIDLGIEALERIQPDDYKDRNSLKIFRDFLISTFSTLGVAYFELQNPEQSLFYFTRWYEVLKDAHFQRPFFIDPFRTDLRGPIRAFFEYRDYDKAWEITSWFYTLSPKNIDFPLWLGKISLQKGYALNAKKYFEAALSNVLDCKLSEIHPSDLAVFEEALFEIGKYLPLTFKTWEALLTRITSTELKKKVALYFLDLYYQSDRKTQEIILEIYTNFLAKTQVLDIHAADHYLETCYFKPTKVKHAEKNIYACARLLKDYEKKPLPEAGQLADNIFKLSTLENIRHYFKLAMARDERGVLVFEILKELLSPEKNLPNISPAVLVCMQISVGIYLSPKPTPADSKEEKNIEALMNQKGLALGKIKAAMQISSKDCCATLVNLVLKNEYPSDFLSLSLQLILLSDQETMLRTLLAEIERQNDKKDLAALCQKVVAEIEKEPEKISGNHDLLLQIKDFVNEQFPSPSSPPENIKETSMPVVSDAPPFIAPEPIATSTPPLETPLLEPATSTECAAPPSIPEQNSEPLLELAILDSSSTPEKVEVEINSAEPVVQAEVFEAENPALVEPTAKLLEAPTNESAKELEVSSLAFEEMPAVEKIPCAVESEKLETKRAEEKAPKKMSYEEMEKEIERLKAALEKMQKPSQNLQLFNTKVRQQKESEIEMKYKKEIKRLKAKLEESEKISTKLLSVYSKARPRKESDDEAENKKGHRRSASNP